MKPFIFLSLVAMMLTGTASMQAQNKTKAKTQTNAKSQKATTKNTTKTTAKTTTKSTTKTTKTTSKTTTPKATVNILYIEPENRNYAQNLGGHMFWDYTAKESNGLLGEFNISKNEKKELIAQYSYSTYELAFENLPV